jgi:uncharacterized protein Yka (UPF0111/DUF47 family)
MSFSLNLLPRENIFYDLIGESGELAYLCMQLLTHLVHETDPERAIKLGEDIQSAKNRSKKVTQDITQRLCKTFITPLDREDIHSLANALYRIPKICEKAQQRMITFCVKPEHDDLYKLTDNMGKAAEQVHYLIKTLKDFKDSEPVYERCELLNNIETDTDELLAQLMEALFLHEQDTKRLMIREDLYNLIENAVDSARDIGNIVLEIVLKHT